MIESKWTIVYHTVRGTQYLCGLEFFSYGDRILPFFSLLRSQAIPLSYDQAISLQKRLQRNVFKIKFVIIKYPIPDQEVTDNEG